MQIFNLYKFCNLKQNFPLYVVFVVYKIEHQNTCEIPSVFKKCPRAWTRFFPPVSLLHFLRIGMNQKLDGGLSYTMGVLHLDSS
jgi:hypothetical protein